MAKSKTIFVCNECGATSPKWVGKCPHWQAWNTYQEEVVYKEPGKKGLNVTAKSLHVPIPITEVQPGRILRMPSQDLEFDRVLGGGIVPGSIVLIGGQPGIGKSTLLLQIALLIKRKVLYVSGEESEEQIRMRADRLSNLHEGCFLLTETNLERILDQAEKIEPDLLIVDSIQTTASSNLESTQGSVSQVRECAAALQKFAKASGIPVFLIGHITKEGQLAGPKLLEHLVDTVLQFEGDRHYTYRIIRTLKNRFGSTDEMGIYEMESTGLRPVENPSELLLSQSEEQLSGSAVAATIEGMRPMLIETQALVSKAVYGNPQRSATGFDLRRLSMLLAVLEKRGGFPFIEQDVFLNIAGGIKVVDPALDLAIVSALLSSLSDISLPKNICFAGEIGLSGEIRAVSKVEQRIQEAAKLGFERIYISKYNAKADSLSRFPIQIRTLSRVQDLLVDLFT